MNMNRKKRQRSENWLEEDKITLKDLVRERVRAIENKNTDTNTNATKVAAWNDLKESFNCMCKGPPRTVTQLKTQWGLIKIKEKKTKAPETTSEDISSCLPNKFIIDSNEFDSDNINQKILNVDNIEATPPQTPSGSQLLGPKPRKIEKRIHVSNIKVVSPAEQVAACELECRRELHVLQVKNENLRTENLNLEKDLLKCKIEYYKKKLSKLY